MSTALFRKIIVLLNNLKKPDGRVTQEWLHDCKSWNVVWQNKFVAIKCALGGEDKYELNLWGGKFLAMFAYYESLVIQKAKWINYSASYGV